MKSNLKHLFMKSFAIAAGITAGIVGVSVVAINVSDIVSKTDWATGVDLTAADLNAIGTNIENIKNHLATVNNLATASLACGGGQVAEFDGASWVCKPNEVGHPPVVANITPHTVNLNDDVIYVDTGIAGGSFVVNLPAISTVPPGKKITIYYDKGDLGIQVYADTGVLDQIRDTNGTICNFMGSPSTVNPNHWVQFVAGYGTAWYMIGNFGFTQCNY